MPPGTGKHRRDPGIIWLVMLVFAAVTSMLSLTRFHAGGSSIADLGIFHQLLWNLVENGAFTTSLLPPFGQSPWLGFHFSPLLMAIAPLYLLWPAPEMLLVLQPCLIALSAWPLYRGGMALGLSARAAMIWSACYLLNPFTLNAAVWDFHEVALATPLMACALLAVIRREFFPMLGYCVLLLCCKEHYGLAVAGFGLLWGYCHTQWRRGLAVCAGGLICLYLIVAIAMPWFGGQAQHPMLADETVFGISRYAWLQSGMAEWMRSATTVFFSGANPGIAYGAFLVLFTLGMPLLAPVWLLPGMADLAANLLSSVPMPRAIVSYHSLTLIPVMIVAAMAGYRRWIARRKADEEQKALTLIVTLSLCFAYWTFPYALPGAVNLWSLEELKPARPPAIASVRHLINTDDRVLVQSNIGAYFTDRLHIAPLVLKAPTEPADIVILYLSLPFRHSDAGRADYTVQREDYRSKVTALLQKNDYGVALWQDGWLVMKRGAKDAVKNRLEMQGALTAALH